MNLVPSTPAAKGAKPWPLSSRSSQTFPHGFADFLPVSPGRRHHAGEHELRPDRLARFNQALHELSPEAPAI